MRHRVNENPAQKVQKDVDVSQDTTRIPSGSPAHFFSLGFLVLEMPVG